MSSTEEQVRAHLDSLTYERTPEQLAFHNAIRRAVDIEIRSNLAFVGAVRTSGGQTFHRTAGTGVATAAAHVAHELDNFNTFTSDDVLNAVANEIRNDVQHTGDSKTTVESYLRAGWDDSDFPLLLQLTEATNSDLWLALKPLGFHIVRIVLSPTDPKVERAFLRDAHLGPHMRPIKAEYEVVYDGTDKDLQTQLHAGYLCDWGRKKKEKEG